MGNKKRVLDIIKRDPIIYGIVNVEDKEHIRKNNPVTGVIWIKADKLKGQPINPNSVAPEQMKLLAKSIITDGFCFPVVVYYDEDSDDFYLVDGAHRTYTVKHNKEVNEMTKGYVPAVVIDKPIESRHASTVRFNRARGKHSVEGMADLVIRMMDNGVEDKDIINELGMEAEELVRLKVITGRYEDSGFADKFKDVEYTKAWTSTNQLKIKKAHKDKQ